MSSFAKSLLEELKTKKLYLDEALNYFKEKGYQPSREESLELIEEMTKIDIFRWLKLVGYLLRKIAAPDERFFDVLHKILEKTNRDLTQSWLIQDLVQIGFDDPESGLQIYKKALELNEPDLFLSCRWIFGGIGKRNFDLVHKDILADIRAANSELRILAITAIRVAFAEGIPPNWEKEILLLLDNSREDPEQKVRIELLNTYLTFYAYAKESCFTGIMELLKQNTELEYFASNLLLHPNLAKHHYSTLISVLAKSDDKAVLENVLFSIYKLSEAEFIESELVIIRSILERFSFFELKTLNKALNKMGEVNLKVCLTSVYSWANEKNFKIQYYAPRIAVEFARNDFGKLAESLASVMDEEEMLSFALETSRTFLEEIYDRSSEGKNLSEPDKKSTINLLEKLKIMAGNRGLDSEEISNREQSIIFKCALLIESIQNVQQNVDYDLIWHNLECFPNIKQFIGEKWFKKMETEKNRTHPLITRLSDDLLDGRELERKLGEIDRLKDVARKMDSFRIGGAIRNRAFLMHLENGINSIKGKPSLKTVKASLRREEHFWKVISEVDVMSRLIGGPFQVKISPSLEVQAGETVKLKHPDLGVTFEGSEIYIEVISPDMFAPLRYFRGASIPNRVRGKITEEIKSHFKGMKIQKDVIVIMDFGSSEIQYSNIQNYVEGEPQFVLRVNRVTNEVVETFNQRGDTMAELDVDTRIVIGIIGYARVVGSDGKIHLKGRKFLNPQASNKLKILENITQVLLG